MKTGSASLWVVVSLLCAPVFAHAETWRLNQLDIIGDVNFTDDFADGLRNSAPTSSLIDQLGNTTEGGGALQFDSSDGGFLFMNPPFPDAIRDQIVFNQPVVDLVSGGTALRGHFDPMLTEIASGSTADAYGIFISSFSGGAFLNVSRDFLGNPTVAYLDETGAAVGFDGINIAGVTGDIVLDLSLDQTTDEVTPRYSIDGGTSFIEFATWDVSGALIDVDYTPLFPGDFVALGVYGQTAVPVPPAILFLGSGIAALVFRRRLA